MIKTFTAFFLFLQLSIFLPGQQSDNKVLASVGTHNILFSQFTERYTDYLIAAGLKDNISVRQAILNNMVNEILLRYYDNNDKILTNEEYNKEINWIEKQVVLAFLKDQEIHAKIPVTDEELRETFVRVNETISASHLFTPSEEEAYQIYDLLNMGVDWDNLAYQLFSDSLLRSNGGYVGFFTWGDMDAAFEDAAYSLKPGEYSKPVKTAYGYSIVRVEERKPHPLLTEWEYNLKKPKLTSLLKLRKKKSAEKNYVDNILAENELHFNDKNLSELFSYLSYSRKNEKPHDFVNAEAVSFSGKTYTSEEVLGIIDGIPSYKKERVNSIESLKATILGLLLQNYLLNQAVQSGYDTIDYVKGRIESGKMQVFLNYKQREVLDAVNVAEEDMRNFYKENINHFKSSPEWNLQEIIVNELSLADSLKYALTEGEDFGKLAVKYSERTWSAANNGETGFIREKDLGVLRELVKEAEIGRLIGPLRLEDKFGIFRVLGKKDGEIKSYESVKDIVLMGVKFEQRGKHLLDHINRLYSLADVNINEELLIKEQIAGLN